MRSFAVQVFEGFAQSTIETERGWDHARTRLGTVTGACRALHGGRARPAGQRRRLEAARGPDNFEYSRRAVAGDQAEMMAALGFDRFAVVGHDRGGRVAHRFALDHTERVTKLAVLDIVPPYRAGATIDLDHGEHDLERKLSCPLLAFLA
jgi:pimeloyl-ACP methyl ester carboxylesterase